MAEEKAAAVADWKAVGRSRVLSATAGTATQTVGVEFNPDTIAKDAKKVPDIGKGAPSSELLERIESAWDGTARPQTKNNKFIPDGKAVKAVWTEDDQALRQISSASCPGAILIGASQTAYSKKGASKSSYAFCRDCAFCCAWFPEANEFSTVSVQCKVHSADFDTKKSKFKTRKQLAHSFNNNPNMPLRYKSIFKPFMRGSTANNYTAFRELQEGPFSGTQQKLDNKEMHDASGARWLNRFYFARVGNQCGKLIDLGRHGILFESHEEKKAKKEKKEPAREQEQQVSRLKRVRGSSVASHEDDGMIDDESQPSQQEPEFYPPDILAWDRHPLAGRVRFTAAKTLTFDWWLHVTRIIDFGTHGEQRHSTTLDLPGDCKAVAVYEFPDSALVWSAGSDQQQQPRWFYVSPYVVTEIGIGATLKSFTNDKASYSSDPTWLPPRIFARSMKLLDSAVFALPYPSSEQNAELVHVQLDPANWLPLYAQNAERGQDLSMEFVRVSPNKTAWPKLSEITLGGDEAEFDETTRACFVRALCRPFMDKYVQGELTVKHKGLKNYFCTVPRHVQIACNSEESGVTVERGGLDDIGKSVVETTSNLAVGPEDVTAKDTRIAAWTREDFAHGDMLPVRALSVLGSQQLRVGPDANTDRAAKLSRHPLDAYFPYNVLDHLYDDSVRLLGTGSAAQPQPPKPAAPKAKKSASKEQGKAKAKTSEQKKKAVPVATGSLKDALARAQAEQPHNLLLGYFDQAAVDGERRGYHPYRHEWLRQIPCAGGSEEASGRYFGMQKADWATCSDRAQEAKGHFAFFMGSTNAFKCIPQLACLQSGTIYTADCVYKLVQNVMPGTLSTDYATASLNKFVEYERKYSSPASFAWLSAHMFNGMQCIDSALLPQSVASSGYFDNRPAIYNMNGPETKADDWTRHRVVKSFDPDNVETTKALIMSHAVYDDYNSQTVANLLKDPSVASNAHTSVASFQNYCVSDSKTLSATDSCDAQLPAASVVGTTLAHTLTSDAETELACRDKHGGALLALCFKSVSMSLLDATGVRFPIESALSEIITGKLLSPEDSSPGASKWREYKQVAGMHGNRDRWHMLAQASMRTTGDAATLVPHHTRSATGSNQAAARKALSTRAVPWTLLVIQVPALWGVYMLADTWNAGLELKNFCHLATLSRSDRGTLDGKARALELKALTEAGGPYTRATHAFVYLLRHSMIDTPTLVAVYLEKIRTASADALVYPSAGALAHLIKNEGGSYRLAPGDRLINPVDKFAFTTASGIWGAKVPLVVDSANVAGYPFLKGAKTMYGAVKGVPLTHEIERNVGDASYRCSMCPETTDITCNFTLKKSKVDVVDTLLSVVRAFDQVAGAVSV